MPDVFGVLPDRTVRRKLAHACDIQDGHARPVCGVAIGLIDRLLAVQVSPLMNGGSHSVILTSARFSPSRPNPAPTPGLLAGIPWRFHDFVVVCVFV